MHDDKPDSSQPSQLDSRNYIIHRVWAELLARKGEALAKTGKGADASKAIRQAIEITEDISKQENATSTIWPVTSPSPRPCPPARASATPQTGP